MKTFSTLAIFCLLVIDIANGIILPLRRIDNQTYSDATNIPYTVQVKLFENYFVNLVIDPSTPLTFVFCCRSPFVEDKIGKDLPFNLFCVKQDRCAPFYCQNNECPNRIHKFIHYVNGIKTDANIYRQNPDLDIDLFGFSEGPLFNYSANPPKDRMSRQIETTYSNSYIWEYTDGTLGLSYSPFNVSFYKYMKTFYTASQRQFALDIFDERQRKNHAYLLPNFTLPYSYGGHMIVGTDSIVKYLFNTSFSTNPISWSEPLKRYNKQIWKILTLPLNDPQIAQDEQLQLLRYDYNYGHRFNMYDLSLECGNEIKNLFYNYSGVWQAEIVTSITGIALPNEFYEMINSWRHNNTYSPVIRFGLEQGGRIIRVPLSWFDIQMYAYTEKEQIKIAPGIGIISPDPVIRIGSRFLEKYFVVLDMNDYRVGFISKEDITERTFHNTIPVCAEYYYIDGTCVPRVQCIGSQRYYEPMNMCLDPECTSYYFQSVDEQSKECTMDISFYILFVIMLGTCCMCEFIVYEIYRRLSAQLVSRAASGR